MNLRQALTYQFADRSWPRKFGLIALISPVPIFGQLYALGYANLVLRHVVSGEGDGVQPDVRLGWELCWLGMQMVLVTLICGVAVAFLGAPLLIGQGTDVNSLAPALIHSLQGPSALLITTVSTVVTAVVMTRMALTGRIGGGFDVVAFWKLLRAEPAIWISYAIIGYVVTEGPYALVWVLPLHGGWDVGATLLACSVLWTYGLMINMRLIGEAYTWSKRTDSLRTAQVRYRW